MVVWQPIESLVTIHKQGVAPRTLGRSQKKKEPELNRAPVKTTLDFFLKR